MRKKILAANWKMNLTKSEAVALASALAAKANTFGDTEVAVIPAFVHLDAVLTAAIPRIAPSTAPTGIVLRF